MRLRGQAYHVHRTCTRIKLRDVATDKAMHSHEVHPPVSDVGFQDEVSAYGMTGFAGGINNDWTVEIERATGATENRASARGRQLQGPWFHFQVLGVQKVMWTTNPGLTDRHSYDSRPLSLPHLHRGIIVVILVIISITVSRSSVPWPMAICEPKRRARMHDEFLDEYSGLTVPLNRTTPVETIRGEPGGHALVVEDKLGQDAVAPPQDDHTTAVPIGVAEPRHDSLGHDDEKEISVVKFQPTHVAPEPASGGRGGQGACR
ncbi:hypothetical protein M405DRAFT_838477 [Rhizopogon salebrosus TDB-379]|nr:hypothetical protein M405DRAFT_838477 [Rhizopogon salebrosus TDB-379]